MEKQSAIRYQGVILGLIFIPFLLSWYWWDDLPDKVPIHWNARGEVDGYGPKLLNLLLLPGINLFVNGLFWAVPYLDPKQNVGEFIGTLRKYQVALNLFMLVFYLAVMGASLGYQVPFAHITNLAMFALFAVLGNYFGKLRPNHFVGLRLPWTLESEENWNLTHRFAGRLWLFGSIAAAIIYLLLSPVNFLYILFPFLALAVGIPSAYSYWLFREEKA